MILVPVIGPQLQAVEKVFVVDDSWVDAGRLILVGDLHLRRRRGLSVVVQRPPEVDPGRAFSSFGTFRNENVFPVVYELKAYKRLTEKKVFVAEAPLDPAEPGLLDRMGDPGVRE